MESNPEYEEIVAIVGLGYVGLPLAIEFGKKYSTIGFDTSQKKVLSYLSGYDPTGEIDDQNFCSSKFITFTSKANYLSKADFIIVAVPTPVDDKHSPDLEPLVSACRTVGQNLKKNSTVIFESTVYPGATEEVCIPTIERVSGMKWKHDFYVGYSPERINPGDKDHQLTSIVKVVSGDSENTTKNVAKLYSSIIWAGVFVAASIKVAEAAKVIENTQRDLNIALMNELAIIFDKMNIDTTEVLNAASTKWNFLSFKPGLVGGHCIGVDPYYLTHKAKSLGYSPRVILAGRAINDGMAGFIAEKTLSLLLESRGEIRGARVNILGLTFKENCSDIRNSKVPEIVEELQSRGVEVSINDPLADAEGAFKEYGLKLTEFDKLPVSDAVILAVAHEFYTKVGVGIIKKLTNDSGCLIDVKAVFGDTKELEGRRIWRL
jgi:UDP-N-acetyl-D-glucosamine/UDP-N-acetyl-D-galactosamine dehydrogenase